MQKVKGIANSVLNTNTAVLAVTVWAFALVSVFAAAYQCKRAVASFYSYTELTERGNSSSKINLEKVPLTNEDYSKVKESLGGVYGGVVISAALDGIEISVKSIDKYETLREVVKDVISSNQGARWDALSLCMGSGCNSDAYKILMQGYTPKFKI